MANRIYPLDAFRGFAAIAVVLFHYTTKYDELVGFRDGKPFDFCWGYLGVHFFFIVSGFVIFMTVQRTKRPLDFVFSRFTRLYPTFWAGVTVTALWLLLFQSANMPTPKEILINLTMLHEFFGIRAVDGVYWTLTRELIFYVLAFGTLLVKGTRHIVPILFAWLGLQCVTGTLARLGIWTVPWTIEFYLLLEFCHLFASGIVFYKLFEGQNKETPEDRYAELPYYGLLALALLNQFILGKQAFGAGVGQDVVGVSALVHNLIIAAFFGLFLAVAKGRLQFLAVKPFVFLGSVSYALYLVHQKIGMSILQAFDQRGVSALISMLIAAGCSLVLATAITWYVEKPSIRWLRSLYYESSEAKTKTAILVQATSEENGTSETNEIPRIDAVGDRRIEPGHAQPGSPTSPAPNRVDRQTK